MRKFFKRLRKSEKGQGMTEYIIIVALIAIAAIGAITLFGDNIRNLFSASNEALSGETKVDPGTTSNDKHRKAGGLKNFTKTLKSNK